MDHNQASVPTWCDTIEEDMTVYRFALLLVLILLMGAYVTSAQQQKPVTPQAAIEAADENKDGHVDRGEYLKTMSDGFFFLDTNKDGFLTIDEILQGVQGADRQR